MPRLPENRLPADQLPADHSPENLPPGHRAAGRWAWAVADFVAAAVLFASATPGVAQRLPLLLTEDFEHGMSRWQTTDVDRSFWKVELLPGGGDPQHVLRVLGQSTYVPPHRSPHSIALLKDVLVEDFVLTARVQSTDSESGDHRDMCIFWGYQDPAHFYYVHFGAKADPAACQIFVVDEAPRRPITVKQASGTPWTDDWHDVKVVRCVRDGTTEVYFDNMDEPLMTAQDTALQWGQVGLGTFDNHGNWDDFELRGVQVQREGR